MAIFTFPTENFYIFKLLLQSLMPLILTNKRFMTNLINKPLLQVYFNMSYVNMPFQYMPWEKLLKIARERDAHRPIHHTQGQKASGQNLDVSGKLQTLSA